MVTQSSAARTLYYMLDAPPFLFQSSSLISNATATALLSLGAIDYCLHVLKSLLEFWKSQQGEEEPVATSQLLRPHTASSPPDMSPFFLRQYVKVSDNRKNLYLKYWKNWLSFRK